MRFLLPLFCGLALLASSCSQTDPDTPDVPEREKSLPEKVETEVAEILAKPWGPILDTVKYFNTNFLLKGKFKGNGPDSVYYELKSEYTVKELTLRLYVEDSLFVTARGSILPVSLEIRALDTDLGIRSVGVDSLGISVGKIDVTAPLDFIINKNRAAALFYEKSRVGYLTRDLFENEDFSTGRYLVIHYDNDPRTFAFHDNIF